MEDLPKQQLQQPQLAHGSPDEPMVQQPSTAAADLQLAGGVPPIPLQVPYFPFSTYPPTPPQAQVPMIAPYNAEPSLYMMTPDQYGMFAYYTYQQAPQMLLPPPPPPQQLQQQVGNSSALIPQPPFAAAPFQGFPMQPQQPQQMIAPPQMQFYCCTQMPFLPPPPPPPPQQQQQQLHQDVADNTDTAQPLYHQLNNGAVLTGYADQFCHQQQQQQQAAAERPEANFDCVDSQQPRYVQQRGQKPAASSLPTPPHAGAGAGPRRRNGYMHNILYKTELCRDVEEKGACPRGKTCQFAHSPAELHDPRKHPLYKTAFCFDYKNRGFCPRGQHCFHVHDISELRTPPPPMHHQQPQFCAPVPQSQPQQLFVAPSPSSSSSTGRGRNRSGRQRGRGRQNSQQLLDAETPSTSGEQLQQPRRGTASTPVKIAPTAPQPSSVVSVNNNNNNNNSETPFNFLMKKLQQQHQQLTVEKQRQQPLLPAVADVCNVEEKTKSLSLVGDAWALEPVRAAQ